MHPLARPVLLAGLLLAGCGSLPARHVDLVEQGRSLWTGLTPASSAESVPEEEVYLSQLLEHPEPDAAACRKHREGLVHYLNRVPVDLGMWRMAEHCAETVDATEWERRARNNIDALVEYALSDGGASTPWQPASVLHAWDIPELAAERGLEIKWMRVLSLDSVRHLLVEASMVDDRGRENRYYFDLLDAILRLNFDNPEDAYPLARRSLAFATLETDAMAGDPLALTGYLYMDLETGQFHPVPARRALRHAWEGGEAGGGVMLLEMCLTGEELDCDRELMESVTDGLIELDIAEGHVLKTAWLVREGRSIDDPGAVAALDRAAALSDRGRMLYYLADVLSEPRENMPSDRAALVDDLLRRSADLDNGVASLRLAAEAIAATPEGAELPGWVETQLERAASQGLPRALHLKGQWFTEDPTERMALLSRAAELGLPEAQLWLGLLQVDSDEAEAERWLKRAADGGSLVAMRLLAQRRLLGIAGQVDVEAAAAWLFSAWDFGDAEAAAWMVALHALHPELKPDSPTPALDMAGILGVDLGRDQTARHIDQVFSRIRPFRNYPGKARALLQGLSAKGWASASLILAERAARELDAGEDAGKAEQWYRRAVDQGSIEAQYQLAGLLLYDNRDIPAAMLALRRAADLGHTTAANDLAYMLCTGDKGAERDAGEGLRIIERVFEHNEQRHPFYYSTLAACQAANGDFESALRNHDIALTRSKLEFPDAADVHEDMRKRLELYREGRPYIWGDSYEE